MKETERESKDIKCGRLEAENKQHNKSNKDKSKQRISDQWSNKEEKSTAERLVVLGALC